HLVVGEVVVVVPGQRLVVDDLAEPPRDRRIRGEVVQRDTTARDEYAIRLRQRPGTLRGRDVVTSVGDEHGVEHVVPQQQLVGSLSYGGQSVGQRGGHHRPTDVPGQQRHLGVVRGPGQAAPH